MVGVGELRATVGNPTVARSDLWTRWGRQAQWVLWAVPVVVVVAMAWRLRWMSDDGFIHLRVVQQVVDGHGPVFNAGERVEASTSPLWVALLTIAYPLTGVALPWKAVLLGLGLTAGGLVAAQRAAALLPLDLPAVRGVAAGPTGSSADRRVLVPLGAVVVAALPPFWEFATSGLETGMAFGWLGTSSWWCAHRATCDRAPSRRAEVMGAVLVSLGWLIRPDLVLFSFTFGVVLLVAAWPRGWRRRLGVTGGLVALPVAYQVFRMGFYAMVVPNTALAKKATTAQWGQGWQYLTDLLAPYWLWLPLGILIGLVVAQAARDRRAVDRGRLRALARLAPVLAGLAHGLYMVRLGGDFMHARLLLPSVFGLVAPVGVRVPLAGGRAALRHVLAPAAVGVWAVVCAALLRPDYHYLLLGASWAISDDGTIAHERATAAQMWQTGDLVRLDQRWFVRYADRPDRVPRAGTVVLLWSGEEPVTVPLRSDVPARAAGAIPAIGVGSYAWGPDVHVVDTFSLAHPIGSHIDHMLGERPGHQKPVPLAWQAAGLTGVRQVLTSDGATMVSARDLEAARRASGCGRLGRYLDDIRDPLTPGRFAGNLADSLANTSLRISAFPQQAADDLCG